MKVSVVIPTYRRPEGLRSALHSLLRQTRAPGEIVVADNSPEGGARDVVEAARAVAPFPVRYVHEPRPGVSNARNAGFAAARGRFIAFLDDDEIADPVWLSALLNTAERLEANVVFGRIDGDAKGARGLRAALAARLYSRAGPDRDIRLNTPFGCGNSLIDREAFPLPEAPFDPAYNQTGGEDDAFFAWLGDVGAQFAWSARAICIERVPENRRRWGHLFKRGFAYGQGASQAAAARKGADKWLRVAAWMAIGAGQCALYGPAAIALSLFRPDLGAACLDKAIQGAGKLVWFDWAEPRFYGEAGEALPES